MNKYWTAYLVFVAVILMLAIGIAHAGTSFNGLVTQVHDGDTITVLNETGAPEKIRLYRIDSPEMKGTKWGYQPHASESRTALLNLCKGKIAAIKRIGKSYTRTVGTVACDGKDVTDYLILTGNAWAYRYTATKAMKAEQANAESRGVGLWALPSPVEPYLWRKGITQ